MPLTQHDFDKHLASIKTIVAARAIRLPSCFISYAWEASKDQNEKLQTWLKKLKQDLETIGIETFLDICQMNGDMRECMQENIRKSDYILLIGTERFKSRIEEDRLCKTSRDSFNAYKKHFVLSPKTCIQMYKSFVQGKAVVLIEDQGTNFIAFIENGKVLLEIPVPQEMKSEFGRIRWLPKDALGIYVAELNKAAYEIIDQAKKEINFKLSAKPIGNSVTNVAFEFGFALEKKEHHPNTIIPLLYSGDFRTSFPEKIFDILIRDMRDSINYYDLLIGLNNPLGIIPAMCSELACSEEYKELLNGQNPDKPEVKFGQRGKEHVMYTNITPDGLVTLDFSIPAAELTTEQELGRGGYGIVYLGKRKHNHVAIKQLTTAVVSKEELSEFNKEAIIMAQLGRQCPQLVQLFGICFEEPYRLVMELLIRGSLYSLLRNDCTLDWKLKSNIARDVAIGLDFLHDHNVIHRDIKSSNILLSKDFSAKLSDYGLAKIKEGINTSVGQAVGTLPWMAPELIADEPLYSIYSDIYSYGLVLLEMATHKTPFEGIKNSASLINKITTGTAEPIPPETPLHFAGLINKCRNKSPESRPNTAYIIQLLNQQRQQLKPTKSILFLDEVPVSSVGYSGSSQVEPRPLSSASISSGASSPTTESTELEKMKLSNFLEHRKPRIPTIQVAKSKPVPISNVSSQAVLQFLHHVGYGEQADAAVLAVVAGNPNADATTLAAIARNQQADAAVAGRPNADMEQIAAQSRAEQELPAQIEKVQQQSDFKKLAEGKEFTAAEKNAAYVIFGFLNRTLIFRRNLKEREKKLKAIERTNILLQQRIDSINDGISKLEKFIKKKDQEIYQKYRKNEKKYQVNSARPEQNGLTDSEKIFNRLIKTNELLQEQLDFNSSKEAQLSKIKKRIGAR